MLNRPLSLLPPFVGMALVTALWSPGITAADGIPSDEVILSVAGGPSFLFEGQEPGVGVNGTGNFPGAFGGAGLDMLDAPGGPVSDTLLITATPGCPGTTDLCTSFRITFTSDSDPGGLRGVDTPTIVESGLPQDVTNMLYPLGAPFTVQVLSDHDVPEPTTLTLLGSGLVALWGLRRWRRRI